MERATSLANLDDPPLDPVGIETGGNSPLGGAFVGFQERQDDLKLLADMTGGRTVMHTSTPEEHLSEIFGESHSYLPARVCAGGSAG